MATTLKCQLALLDCPHLLGGPEDELTPSPSHRRGSYAPILTPRSPDTFRVTRLAKMKPCSSVPNLLAIPQQRAPSSLFKMILERGERRGSCYPVIDSLYPAQANQGVPTRSTMCQGTCDSPVHVSIPTLSLPAQYPQAADHHDRDTEAAQSPTTGAEGDDKCCITVAVRVRPFTKAESQAIHIMDVDANTITVTDPGRLKNSPPQQFTFDHLMWSVNNTGDHPLADQKFVYDTLGHPLLQNLIRGYNACLLCYGQTGSGKTYTMMGTSNEPGIVPRYAEAVFQCLEEQQKVHQISTYRVQVSYIEIYNEKVRDLLVSDKSTKNSSPKNLRVRQHPVRGSFVEGLTHHTVTSGAAILKLMKHGNDQRATAATKMNEHSSRSHAVVTIDISQQALITQANSEELFSSKTSRIHLVDLAGSERATKSDIHVTARFQELTAINQSLTTLSRVIETLSDNATTGAHKLPPYRESMLTWLLVDSFGGNSKTTMIANVSPAASNLSETLSTLRYASRARKIVNKAVINEDPSAALISALQEETQQLRAQLMDMSAKQNNSLLLQQRLNAEEVDRLRNKLRFSEKLIEELQEHEKKERLDWEMRFQRMSVNQGKHQEKQQEMLQNVQATEKQLEKAQAEVQRRAEEVASLHHMLAEKEEELARKAGQQELLQDEIRIREEEISQREALLETICSERQQLEQCNAEMLMRIMEEVTLRESEFKERLRWEEKAKATEQQLQAEIAQRQERIAAEQMLIEVLRGERETILSVDGHVMGNHTQLMNIVALLQKEQTRLQANLQASEVQLDHERAKWETEIRRVQQHEQDSLAQCNAQAQERLQELEAEVCQLQQRVGMVSKEQEQLVNGEKDAETAVKGVIAMCEQMVDKARQSLVEMAKENVETAATASQTDSLSSTMSLEEMLHVLEMQDKADMNAMIHFEKEEGQNIARLLMEGQITQFAASSDRLLQALVEEYSLLLQSALQSRSEWKDLFEGLSLTMQAVSGRPRMWWFSKPIVNIDLDAALRRQEELNARASAWLMGLHMQREVLKQNVCAQLHINQKLANERSAILAERNSLSQELDELSGKFRRALTVIRRLHDEKEHLLAETNHAEHGAGESSAPPGPSRFSEGTMAVVWEAMANGH